MKSHHKGRGVAKVVLIIAVGLFVFTSPLFASGGQESQTGSTTSSAVSPVDPDRGWFSEARQQDPGTRLPGIEPVGLSDGEQLRVVATTNIVGDVVVQVAGELADVATLIPTGQNPHAWEPSPRDMADVERAHLVFINGLGLEEGFEETLENDRNGIMVPVSAGVAVLDRPGESDESRALGQAGRDESDHSDDEADSHADVHGDHGEETDHGEESDHGQESDHTDANNETHSDGHHDHQHGNPHTWFSPLNAMIWVENIRYALSSADPANAEGYRNNAEAYLNALGQLDREMQSRFSSIPEGRRNLVVDHASLGYFARDYGFRILGSVIPNTTDQAEPSSRDIARLVQTIREHDVPAIFIGGTASRGLQNLVDAVAREVGRDLPVLTLLTGSLAASGQAGDTYLEFMKFNTEQIVQGLTGN